MKTSGYQPNVAQKGILDETSIIRRLLHDTNLVQPWTELLLV